jgi:hypothetical protein
MEMSSKMNPTIAKKLVGNQSTQSLKMMIRALELPISKVLNTEEDNLRLEAAKYLVALRTRKNFKAQLQKDMRIG